MTSKLSVLSLIAFIGCISGCGGGGGSGGGGGPQVPSTPTITVTPANFTRTLITGESQYLTLNATLSYEPTSSVYLTIVDTRGVIQPTVSIIQTGSPLNYLVSLQTSTTLSPGNYTGSIQATVCLDQACTRPLVGSPVSFTYNFTVVLPQPYFTLNQPTANGRYVQGFPWTNRLIATPRANSNIYLPNYSVGVTDPTGTLRSTVDIVVTGNGTYTLVIRPVESLTPGRYTGTAQLNVCNFSSCVPPYRTQPVSFDFDFTVMPLKPLVAHAGLPDWEMFQGNARHTGYVPITLNASNFVPRWSSEAAVANSSWEMSEIVTANNRIFYTGARQLIALNQHNGRIDWRRDYYSYPDLVPPSVSDGKVFFATLGYSQTYLWALNQLNGDLVYQSSFGAHWNHHLSATIDRGAIYVGNLYGFHVPNGSQVLNAGMSDHDGWTVAADAQYLYAYMGDIYSQPNSLRIIDRATRQLVARISHPSDVGSAPYTTRSAPILGAAGNVICVDGASGRGYYVNKLVNFDTVSQTVRWVVDGQFPANPAYADGVLYVTNRSTKRFEARSEATGAVLWTWTPPTDEPEFVGDVLATDNLIFFSTDIATYAIDKTTHASVWRYPAASRVSISSNGLLLLSKPWTSIPGGDVVAFDID